MSSPYFAGVGGTAVRVRGLRPNSRVGGFRSRRVSCADAGHHWWAVYRYTYGQELAAKYLRCRECGTEEVQSRSFSAPEFKEDFYGRGVSESDVEVWRIYYELDGPRGWWSPIAAAMEQFASLPLSTRGERDWAYPCGKRLGAALEHAQIAPPVIRVVHHSRVAVTV